MGLARHNPRGQTRLGLSATAGSAVLYSAIVVFGIGSASPSALDVGGDRHRSVVLVPGHADIVPGSVKKLPQASPEPGRHRARVRPKSARPEVVSTTPPAAPAVVETQLPATPPRGKESTSPAVTSPPAVTNSPTAPVAETILTLTVPTLTVPELPAPLPALPLPPVPEPAVPPLPVALPLDLPG
jgi:hypothetical protein